MSGRLSERIERLESRIPPGGRDFLAEREVRQELIKCPELLDLLDEIERIDSTTEKVAGPERLRELKILFNERLAGLNLSERARRLDLKFKIDSRK